MTATPRRPGTAGAQRPQRVEEPGHPDKPNHPEQPEHPEEPDHPGEPELPEKPRRTKPRGRPKRATARADRAERGVRLPPQHTAGQHRAAEEHHAGQAGRAAEDDGAAEDQPAEPDPRPARDLPRWVRWTVLPLLVLVPLGYVIISAEQSRDGGVSKQQEAAARYMTWETPSALQQRIYQVPFPVGATRVGYLETNSWDTSVLYAQFTTTAGGLDTFLAKIGTSRDALRDGRAALTPAQTRAAGWALTDAGPWIGTELHKIGDKPDHDIAVDLSDADAPTVYVVSTVNFQHGFGGG